MKPIPGNPQVDRALQVVFGTQLTYRIVGNPDHLPTENRIEIEARRPVSIGSPCPCGNFGDRESPCHCTTEQISTHRSKWAPVDISIEMVKPQFRDLTLAIKLDSASSQLLKQAYRRLPLTVRQVERVLAVAQRIQALEDSPKLLVQHLAEAIQYQSTKG